MPCDFPAMPRGVRRVTFLQQSQVLTASHDGTARLWNLHGECVQVFRGHSAHVYQATFSSDGQKVVTASADNTALVFDRKGECLQRLTGHASAVYQAVFSPDGSKVLTAAADTFAGLFEVSTGSFLKYFAEHRLAVHSVAFSGDGSKVLTAGDDRAVSCWFVRGTLFGRDWRAAVLGGRGWPRRPCGAVQTHRCAGWHRPPDQAVSDTSACPVQLCVGAPRPSCRKLSHGPAKYG
eukprot:s1379_g6.t1